jgi:NAD(P)-dependent dehydrogenase (short-subunit alcohol dehydrogenase family)
MADLFGLSGRHALVTGASSGLGRHFAGVLAAAGASVTVAARRETALAETVASIAASGGKAQAVRMDVTDASSIERGFAEAEAGFGPVRVVINNAGITMTRAALEVAERDWAGILDTNLKGSWLVAQHAARRLIHHGSGGSIVNIASILGLRVAGGVSP